MSLLVAEEPRSGLEQVLDRALDLESPAILRLRTGANLQNWLSYARLAPTRSAKRRECLPRGIPASWASRNEPCCHPWAHALGLAPTCSRRWLLGRADGGLVGGRSSRGVGRPVEPRVPRDVARAEFVSADAMPAVPRRRLPRRGRRCELRPVRMSHAGSHRLHDLSRKQRDAPAEHRRPLGARGLLQHLPHRPGGDDRERRAPRKRRCLDARAVRRHRGAERERLAGRRRARVSPAQLGFRRLSAARTRIATEHSRQSGRAPSRFRAAGVTAPLRPTTRRGRASRPERRAARRATLARPSRRTSTALSTSR